MLISDNSSVSSIEYLSIFFLHCRPTISAIFQQ